MVGDYTPWAGTPPNELAPLFERSRRVGLEPRAVLPLDADLPKVRARIEQWLDDGRAGEMAYLDRLRELGDNPRRWKPWSKSIVLFSIPYSRESVQFRGGGRVARYAAGRDYHNLLGRRLERLGKALRRDGVITRYRGVTDAAPISEREWALEGALGFRGKSTLLLDWSFGPWAILAELLIDTDWPTWHAAPAATECGSCNDCLEACPTSAFTAPYLLDAKKCISYLTIEHRSPIPIELRQRLGDWVFGCDVCSEVCPFGQRGPDTSAHWGTLPALQELSLEGLLALDRSAFDAVFQGSPIRRAGRNGLLRNACIALANLDRGRDTLAGTLESDPAPLVREAAAWALGRLLDGGDRRARMPLEKRLLAESDLLVTTSLTRALG